MTGAAAPARRGVAAVVLDTDGVITDSARVHAAARKTAFDAAVRAHPSQAAHLRRPFGTQDGYQRFVDGRSRWDGTASFLAACPCALPPGSLAEPRGTGTVGAVAACKERLFTERLREHGIDAHEGTVRLLHALRGRNVPLAAVAASRHARELLTHSGGLALPDEIVDGGEAARLPGKPDRALFLEAGRRLGVPAARAAVVEDAPAGVEAGRRGAVVGVDRTAGPGTADALRERDAPVVVRALYELLTDGPGD